MSQNMLLPEFSRFTIEVYDSQTHKKADEWVRRAMEIVQRRFPTPADYSSFFFNILDVEIEDEEYGLIKVAFNNSRTIGEGGLEKVEWELARVQIFGKNPPFIQPHTKDDTPAAPTVTRVNMGSGWVTGAYYPLAGGMSRVIHNNVDTIALTVESSGASAVNSRMIGSGDLDMAIVQNDVAFLRI